MAITTRQTNLLVNQDWTTLYQSFKNADFQSYDFETIRKSMIDYLRNYYPEDFNDFTESSEYIALIDLIAYLGQSLAFRTDLNARENFFDTAERRDSILKLASLINYNAKRNTPASGYLKIDSVNTTESVFDSNGLNLANLMIDWNDSTNEDWQEQFTAIFNAALTVNQTIGSPGNTQDINGIMTSEYTVNLVPGVTPTYGFSVPVANNNTTFEIVSPTSQGQNYIYEMSPAPSGKFNVLYQNDNLGNGSINTGYFLYFKQGTLNNLTLNLQQSLPNRVVNVNYDNINNTDVWLYQLNNAGSPVSVWAGVPAVAGLNIIYNQSVNRNLYQVNTRSNDQIDLVFGDGSFANIPQGNFKLYYRVSNGLSYKITPDEMQQIVVPITYVSRNNTVETLTITASLHYTVTNSAGRESTEDIRLKAPQQYYTQNRMITGEDYNLFPYTNFSDILKVKAVNRASSGISRYLDVLDVTGKYSSTNIFCTDGILFQQTPTPSETFSFNSINDINNVIYNMVLPILTSTEVKHFYYANFPRLTPTGTNNWLQITAASGSSTGQLIDAANNISTVGYVTNSNLKYITIGSMLRFNAGTGKYFNAQNVITTGTPQYEHDRSYIYATVVNVTNSTTVALSQNIPTGAQLDSIIPVFKNDFTNTAFVNSMINLIQSYKNFGIRYDVESQGWVIIAPEFLSLEAFSLARTGNTNIPHSDSSWIVAFTYNGVSYNLAHRKLEYVFESNAETRFYFDPDVKVFDSKTGLTVNDQITVLKTNTQSDSLAPLGQNQEWFIYNNVIAPDGYIDNTQVLITFPDTNNSGTPDDPDLFKNIVNPTVNATKKYVFFKQVADINLSPGSFITTEPIDNNNVVTDYATQAQILANQTLYISGQVFYATAENNFYALAIDSNNVRTLTLSSDYVAEIGRQDLYFQYRHNSPNDRRIDPSPNNIMDLYILTTDYANAFVAWARDTTGTLTQPILPTNDELKLAYGSGTKSLENYKALSDTIIYNSGKYKPIFGDKANRSLQATFKIVKNSNLTLSDNDVISATISAINSYFNTGNWDFGETFYFSELATYLHNTLAPNVASIIIVPTNTDTAFGGLMQINANPDEILISCATAKNIQIISAITAAQINQTLAGTNVTV
jgi:hypothetical protein